MIPTNRRSLVLTGLVISGREWVNGVVVRPKVVIRATSCQTIWWKNSGVSDRLRLLLMVFVALNVPSMFLWLP